jgi:hypothetical protein
MSGYFQPLFPEATSSIPANFKHVVCFSGGESSAVVACVVASRYGASNTILLNHNISPRTEDRDIKRFKKDVAAYLGIPITYANMQGWHDKDQFDVVLEAGAFKSPKGDVLCTSRLKTEPFRAWLAAIFPNKDCIVYYGFSKEERSRIQRRSGIMGSLGYKTDYPLALWPGCPSSITHFGIKPPATYGVFKHANCIGCLRAGVQHWYIVYVTRPDLWKKAKAAEDEIDYSILKEGFLSELECKFAAMKAAGVPATEKVPAAKFWKAVEITLGNYFQQSTDALSCECMD